jgi:hypothetical protein
VSGPPRSRSGARRRRAALRVAPELADPIGPVKVGQHEEVEQLRSSGWRESVETTTKEVPEDILHQARMITGGGRLWALVAVPRESGGIAGLFVSAQRPDQTRTFEPL